jgi:hypothetical protein
MASLGLPVAILDLHWTQNRSLPAIPCKLLKSQVFLVLPTNSLLIVHEDVLEDRTVIYVFGGNRLRVRTPVLSVVLDKLEPGALVEDARGTHVAHDPVLVRISFDLAE